MYPRRQISASSNRRAGFGDSFRTYGGTPPGCRRNLKPLLVCLKSVGLWFSGPNSNDKKDRDLETSLKVYTMKVNRIYTSNVKPQLSWNYQNIIKDYSKSSSCFDWMFSACCIRKDTIQKTYCCLVCLLLWVNLGIAVSGFRTIEEFDGYACNLFVSASWFLLVAFIATSNLYKHNTKCWDHLLDGLDSFCEVYDLDIRTKTRRLCWCIVLGFLVWLGIAFTFGGLSSLFVLTNEGPFGYISSFALVITVRAVLVLIYFYFVSTWYLLTSLYCVVCVLLVWVFSHVNRDVRRCLKTGGSCKAQLTDVEGLRLQHDRACRLLQAADTTLSSLVLLTIACVIPLIVFTVYFILVYSVQSYQLMAVWWSVSLAVLQLVLVFVLGAGVNHFTGYTNHRPCWWIVTVVVYDVSCSSYIWVLYSKEAHLPVDFLYSVDLRWLAPAKIHQISVFLKRLTAHPIGLTACGLFVIDKPTIMTFAGTIITYTVVVIQFRTETQS